MIVADDDREARRVFTKLLAPQFDVVAAVENGEELVEAARAFEPDLLLIDISMPVLNGMHALGRLMSHGFHGRAVMMSVNGDPAYVRRALLLGAHGYIWKAAGGQDVAVALECALSGTRYASPGMEPLAEAGSRAENRMPTELKGRNW